ncbi:MAG TPA: DUF4333 domain-containing protein [Solirubrobacterales bacterium]|jgi:hypothetical protein
MSLLDWRPATLAVLTTTAALWPFWMGCGGTVIDDAKTEAALKQNLAQSGNGKVSSVECPSGVDVETGATFECTVLLASGKQETATLKILNEDADVEVTALKSSK